MTFKNKFDLIGGKIGICLLATPKRPRLSVRSILTLFFMEMDVRLRLDTMRLDGCMECLLASSSLLYRVRTAMLQASPAHLVFGIIVSLLVAVSFRSRDVITIGQSSIINRPSLSVCLSVSLSLSLSLIR